MAYSLKGSLLPSRGRKGVRQRDKLAEAVFPTPTFLSIPPHKLHLYPRQEMLASQP